MGNFKTLRVWQDAVELVEKIYLVTRKPEFAKDFGLKDQIQRASISISSNIAEGDERDSNKECVHFFSIAKGSAAEVITQLNIAYRVGYISKEELESLEKLAEKIRASIRKLIQSRGGLSQILAFLSVTFSILKPL